MLTSLQKKGLLLGMCGSFLMALIVCVSILSVEAYRLLYKPMSEHPVIIRILPSMSASKMVLQLRNQHLIHSSRLVLLWIRIHRWSHQLKSGIYQIKPYETVDAFFHRVIRGDVLMQSWRVAEGSTHWQIEEQLKQIPYLIDVDPHWSTLMFPYANPEGLLLADTYQFSAGSSADLLVKQAHMHLSEELNRVWEKRAPNLPYKNAYELLIAASVIEKEASDENERRLISGIIVNRLHKHMPLQMDPIVIYGLGPHHRGLLTHQDLSIDSLYNAYHHRGLPPTPIAMIGIRALEAAAHPKESDFLYFVANGDGTHQFSVTYDQQRTAIRRLRRGI